MTIPWDPIRKVLFLWDAETVHEVTADLWQLAVSLPGVETAMTRLLRVRDPVRLLGLEFPNRVGLAAGFDKGGRLVRAASALGFGHLEVGTVTPRPQPGHPRPRIWRIPGRRALRNRMGFPNEGAPAFARRLALQQPYPVPVGVNLGKAHDTPLEEAWRDYCAGLEVLFRHADYVVVNLSSPNTAGLRTLQHGEALERILGPLQETNGRLAVRHGLRPRPVLVKLSPDMADEDLAAAAEALKGLPVDGVVATNTMARRDPPWQAEPMEGGLSGEPLTVRSRETVRTLRGILGPDFPLIGAGGVLTPEDGAAMREAGADLVQIYTGLVYGGPLFPHRLARALKG